MNDVLAKVARYEKTGHARFFEEMNYFSETRHFTADGVLYMTCKFLIYCIFISLSRDS
jgi:hypothetical protein